MARRGNRSRLARLGILGGVIGGGAALISLLPAVRNRAMHVTSLMKRDHRVMRGLIRTLQLTPRINGMMRRTLLGRIRNQMMVHTQAVEEILYPALRNYMTTEGHSRLDDAYREHHQIRDLLNDLQGTDPLTDTFDQKLAQLKIRMERRLADEEVEMFPMLVERMSRDQQHDIGRRIRDRKKDLRMRIAA